MLLHDRGDLCIKLLDRLAGILNLFDQELDGHRGRYDQSLITTQQLGGANAIDDRILLLLVTDCVFTQDAANQPSISTAKLAWIVPACRAAR
jgi:hypothetical protein